MVPHSDGRMRSRAQATTIKMKCRSWRILAFGQVSHGIIRIQRQCGYDKIPSFGLTLWNVPACLLRDAFVRAHWDCCRVGLFAFLTTVPFVPGSLHSPRGRLSVIDQIPFLKIAIVLGKFNRMHYTPGAEKCILLVVGEASGLWM